MRSLRSGLLALALLGGAVGGLVATATPAAAEFSVLGMKNSLVQFLLSQLGEPGVFEITAEEVAEPSDGVTSLEKVAISDAEGAWLTAERVEFSWEPSRLLSGEVEITRLAIIGLEVTRQPVPAPKTDAEVEVDSDGVEFAWPRSPITLHVRDFRMERVFIAEGVIGQSLSFDAVGNARDEGDIQQLALTLTRTDNVQGRIAVEYDRRFEANTFALNVDAREAAGGLVGELAGFPEDSASKLELSAEGPPTDWRIAFQAAVDRVFSAGGGGTVVYEGPVSADLDFRFEPGETLNGDLRAALGEEARLRAKIAEDGESAVRIEQGFLQAATFSTKVDGVYQRDSGEMDFNLVAESTGDLARMIDGASFAFARFDGRLSGAPGALRAAGDVEVSRLAAGPFDSERVTIATEVTQTADGARFSLDGGARAARIDKLDASVLGDIALKVSGALAGERLTLETAAIDSPALTVSVEGGADLGAGAAEFDYRIAAPDLAPIGAAYDADLDGALEASGALSGPFDGLRLVGEAALRDFVLAGEAFSKAEMTHDITLGAGLSGSVRAEAEGARLGAAEVATRLTLADGRLALDGMAARVLGVEAGGDLALMLESGLASGALTLNTPDLRRLGAYLDTSLAGAAKGEATLGAEGGEQRIDADLTLTGVETGDALRLERAVVSASGSLADLALEVDASGRAGGRGFETSAAARLRAAETPQRLSIERASATIETLGETAEIALAAPAEISIGEAEVATDGIALRLPGGGRLDLKAMLEQASGRFAAEARLANVDLAAVGPMAGLEGSSGVIEGSAAIDTRAGREGGTLSLRGRELQLAVAPPEAGAAALRLDGRWNGSRLTLEGSAEVRNAAPARVSLDLPVSVGGSGAPELDQNGSLDGRVRWSGRVETLWALVPAAGHLLEGDLDADFRLGGSIADPRLSGAATLSDGGYQNLDLGTMLTELRLRAEMTNSERLALSFSAKDGGDGALRGEGALTELLTEPAANARISASGATLVRRDDATVAVDADLAFSGPLSSARLSGDVTIASAEIRLINRLPPDIATLGDVRIKGEPEPEPKASSADGGVALDVNVSAPSRIFVRGRGLDSEWAANLTVSGTSAAPRVVGAVTALRGRLDLLGRPFDLDDSSKVQFLGPTDPELSVVFTREANDIEGRVEVAGRASSPELNLTSSPALPEEEVLPRLLFGQSRQSLSAAEALELGAGVATLLSGGEGFTGNVRQALGLDVLGVETGEDGATRLRAGRYVADGVFVGARQGLDAQGGSAFVEVEIFDGVTVDVEADRQGGSSVGAEWRWDF